MPYRAPMHKPPGWRSDQQRRAAWEAETKAKRAPYQTAEWQAARLAFLKANPRCQGCGGRANTVDHVVQHQGDMARFWDRTNWQPLCGQCHQRKRQTEAMAAR